MTNLTPETISTVQATIPFLSENSTKLTSHFYQRMFRENPEVKEFFNPAHQASGSQQGALAGAICAFAQNIETPENLADAISLIAHKHVSLGVLPEHYPIVGENLLAAIDELLDPAPPEILEAWGLAYQFLAEVCIGAEAGLYADKPWQGFKKFRIVKKEEESALISSFYLQAEDGAPAPAFAAGQYLTVRIPTPDGSTTMRNYSLSNHGDAENLRISVKREAAAESGCPMGFVSNHLHIDLKEGDLVEVAAPSGNFVLRDEHKSGPIALISGGVGITPVLSMLHALAGSETKVSFIHGALNGEHHAFREEVEGIKEKMPSLETHYRYSAPNDGDVQNSTGVIDQCLIEQYLAP